MPQRTTPLAVQTLVVVPGTDQAAKDEAIQPYIDMAWTYLDAQIAKCSALGALDASVLEMLERLLSAHFWAGSPAGASANQILKTDNVGDGVGRTWQTPNLPKGFGLATTGFGMRVLQMDTTGCIRTDENDANNQRRKAQIKHVGEYHGKEYGETGDAGGYYT